VGHLLALEEGHGQGYRAGNRDEFLLLEGFVFLYADLDLFVEGVAGVLVD
jgi:hypothetical protein